MRLIALPIPDAWLIEPDRLADDRGWFARLQCARSLAEAGLDGRVAQINGGYCRRAGTVRGVHFQRAPDAETKIVRCTAGSVFDVVVDLRSGSATFGRWHGVELTPEGGLALYVPDGCGHAYQALSDGAEILYTTSREYVAASTTGVRWDDPSVAIKWPLPVTVVSEADRSWPLLSPPAPSSSTGGILA